MYYNKDMIGHVVGFCLNEFKEVLVSVKFANGDEKRLHPTYLVTL